MLQAELKILGGKYQGKLISLNTKKFLVGRESDCHLRPNSDLVSRHHCVFTIDDFTVRLRDLGSTNGTMVNGENLRGEKLLKAGDRVTIGKLELEVVIRQVADKSALPAAPPAPSKAIEEPLPAMTTTEITAQEETETSYALEAFTPPVTDQDSAETAPPDTAVISTFPQQPQPFIPPPPMGYPQQAYPGMMPGYPMGGYMPQPYPAYQTPGYGQMPGYGQPMGYPMQYPQVMPQPSYPAAAVAAPPAATEEAETPSSAGIPVKLPDPSETGFKPVAPAPAAAGGAPQKVEKPSTTAADIIKQYMNKRS